MDKEKLNMVMLGLAFMALFTSFNTMENLEKPFLNSLHDENPSFYVDGYAALALLYFTFGMCLWLAPSMLSLIGPRLAMSCSVMGYSLYISSFFVANSSIIYTGTIVNGIAAALLWCAQGNYVILNSTSKTVSRNASIFWVFYKCSLFFGNIFAFFIINGKTQIDKSSRMWISILLLAFTLAAFVILLFLQKPQHSDSRQSAIVDHSLSSAVQAFFKATKIAVTPNMMMLAIMFCYVGFQVSLHSAVYGGSVGFSHQLGTDSKKLVPLVAICIGLGEMISGGIITLRGTWISQYKWGGAVVVTLGFMVQLIAFFLILINIPDLAAFGDTDEQSYIQSSVALALLCAVMLGFGDGCYTSQIFALLEEMYPKDSSQTVALFNFINIIKCLLCIVAEYGSCSKFYYSTLLGLHTQLFILAVTGVSGIAAFATVTSKVK